uniref:Small ribosomal subunit protein uS4c n=1 Tax=Dichotomosiphon tuberosus TaxID=118263 RepID=A0A386AWX0_9CHLO|nr:ribosomal protein S4 [Dichotomosiphon tuberosus]
MSTYRGPRVKIIRRLGLLPGLTSKISKRKGLPGKSEMTKIKKSQYGIRLNEKQKLRYNYGLTEKKLVKYIQEARKSKFSTVLTLLELLEMRLDNILYRLGLVQTIRFARQLINHGHILVNNKTINIPSYNCKINDIISFKLKSNQIINNIIDQEKIKAHPSFLLLDEKNLIGKICNKIQRSEIEIELNELLVVEYYSRI